MPRFLFWARHPFSRETLQKIFSVVEFEALLLICRANYRLHHAWVWLSGTCRDQGAWRTFVVNEQRPYNSYSKQRITAKCTIELMKSPTITKFVVKVTRNSTGTAQYVLRTDKSPMQMTTNRKLALIMGKLTAQDAAESLQRARYSPELVSVQVRA